MRPSACFVPIGLALALGSCAGEPAPPAGGAAEPDIATMTFAPALDIDVATMTRSPRGVWIKDLSVGTGDPVGSGSLVAIRYAGHLADGTQFDATRPIDPPFEFRIDSGDVIPGYDEAVTGMRQGGNRLALIPPALGYRSRQNGPIPANSVLVFTIELVRAP
jgi:FKBP-type peptidyl-prolyl cis-trans isomerase